MHIRVTKVKRHGKTIEYPQLVESYRRPKDGMPAHKVIASLKNLPAQEIENLRVALAAGRKGQRVVPATVRKASHRSQPVEANLSYLAEAVVWELWRSSGLGSILSELLPTNGAEVAPADVVGLLVDQRCVAPESKLAAQRWFPETALPELVGIAPKQFNNTRIHRVLEQLDSIEKPLQKNLASLHLGRRASFAALFLDVTDTWFVGRGPDLAERGKCKEGFVCRKIGIVLLCDDQGYPLRWAVLSGRTNDSKAMLGIMDELRDIRWAQHVPIACDRAMGRTATIQTMLAWDIPFLTTLLRDEISAYTDRVPYREFEHFEAPRGKPSKDEVEAVAEVARQAGLQQVSSDLFLLDLKIIERRQSDQATLQTAVRTERASDKTIVAMVHARKMQQMLDDGLVATQAEAGAGLGYSKRGACNVLKLTVLPEDIQEAILEGDAVGLSLGQLRELTRLQTPEKMRRDFNRIVSEAAERPDSRHGSQGASGLRSAKRAQDKPPPVRVRAVVCFDPHMLLQQRKSSAEALEQVRLFERDLNTRLATPQSRRSRDSILGEVAANLRKAELSDCFEVHVRTRQVGGRERFVVELQLREAEWARRRRYDGFWVLVTSPAVSLDAHELPRLYRAKDMVEKDIQDIKSVVAIKIHPVRHRTTPKVRAHVTLCMLALYLSRLLENKAAQSLPQAPTAAAALAKLRTIHLNQLRVDGAALPFHTITRCTPEQRRLLSSLELENLADDQEMMDRLTPR